MDLLDLVILGVAASAAIGGFRLGFLARVVSWVGLAAGLVIAARLLPAIVSNVRDADPTSKLLVAALVLLGGAFLGQAVGLIIGTRVGRGIPHGPIRSVDALIGAAVGLVGVLGAVWVLLPSMANVAGWPARQARNSTIARFIDRSFPAPPDTLQALRRLVGDSTFPEVFSALGPARNAGPPPADSGIPAATQARISASTVKVLGEACGRLQEGSGWTVQSGYIVTNAHVVAGERTTTVRLDNGRGSTMRASVVGFDANRDLALLAVPGLPNPVLPLLNAPGTAATQSGLVGTHGAVFGHPGGQDPIAVTPASVSQYISALGRDLYDNRDTRRDVFILAANLAPGDSGGPLVNRSGTVIGVAFAIAPDRPGTSYALSYTEVDGLLRAGTSGPVSTGPCLAD
ncbi:MAG: MarP family serine protease [Acidimicrobiales bacterium]